MYILQLSYENAKLNGSGETSFRCGYQAIRKWTLLDDRARSVEQARLIAMACLGREFLALAARWTPGLCRTGASGLNLESLMVRHPPRDCAVGNATHVGDCFKLLPDGGVEKLDKGHRRLLKHGVPVRNAGLGSGIRRHFALAYGPRWIPRSGDDCFDFAHPHRQRVQRFQSVFDPSAGLTDPSAFLQRLHYRMTKGRSPAILVMRRLAELFGRHLEVATDSWLEKDADFGRIWSELPSTKARMLLPVVDAVRHIVDATPHDLDPLARPGVVVFVHPERACPGRSLAAWFTVIDLLFPSTQFVVVVPRGSRGLLPRPLARKRLPTSTETLNNTRERKTKPGKRHQASLSGDTVLLIDVDSRIPNLALMKLGGRLRQQGRKTVLVRRDNWQHIERAERAYASCVFHVPSSQRRVAKLRERFGDSVSVGGSGEDLKLRLPAEVEAEPADYGLYPELEDRALGFLTRGCSRRCRFCIVPRKEGAPRQASDLDELLQGRKKLVLLDDNLLAHPRADSFLEQMAERNIQVNFNQTLDISLIDKGRAALLQRIGCANYRFSRRSYHFSLNNARRLDIVRRNYRHFGFCSRDNAEFICMYGFDTTLAEDVERFRFLRSLPGAYVFVQEYVPPLEGTRPGLDAFFDDRADQLIEELIRIVFTQNMKSMERYYRWLSQRYLETFKKLHAPLVDTIFRYNQRDRKGLYVAKMLGSLASPAEPEHPEKPKRNV
jgi:hypothetical protein